MPEKWSIDKEDNIIKVYPVPVFKGLNVIGVEYRTNKAVLLPEPLLERLVQLEEDIKAVNKVGAKKVKKATGRPSDKYLVSKWVELKEQGLTYNEIAELQGFNIKGHTVAYHVNKYKKEQAV